MTTECGTKLPTYVSVTEAAGIQGRCTKSIRRAISTGQLPAYRIAGSPAIRLRLDDVLAMLRPIPSGAIAHD